MLLLFSISLFFIVTATALFFTRSYWLQYLPDVNIRLPSADYLYSQLPSTFAGDIEAGLSSTTFDLGSNVEGGRQSRGVG